MKKISFPFLAFTVVLLLSCTASKYASKNLSLQSTYWTLVSVEGVSIAELPQLKTPCIIFDTNYKFHGHFGCNQFFGAYNFGKKKVSMDYAGATKKICSEMQIENLFSKALHKDIKYYTIAGSTLILKDAQKNEILRFLSDTKPEE
ncbi:MAG: META domain-containing protein [Bacteroidales bacterium]|jgi:heat shock protein HslJ|nr:META domain-containing protein [Bacteroidales bacterium]